MREVDDAVRQDSVLGFWKRFGIWIAGAVVLGLVAFGGWLYWEQHSAKKSGETGEDMAKVLETVAGGGTPDAAKLDALSKASQPGYRASAQLARAAVAMQKGDEKGAVAIYQQMSADTGIGQPYRDLATVRATALEFEKLRPQDIVARLKPLAIAGDPWFGSAGEMTAIAYMKMRKPDLAGPIFAAMAKDDKVPQSIRSRARQMAGLLGIDAVDTEQKTQNGDGSTNAQ